MKIVLIDLFAGTGGFIESFKRQCYEIEHSYFSEIDKHAIANYKYNNPDAEYIGSVTDVSGTAIREKHPNSTIVVTGGFPCQDISIAGKRKGFEPGTRSSLFFEAIRIIAECSPEIVIVENVKGLSSSNKGMDFITAIKFLAYLNTDSPQYDVECFLCNTSWILPQNRERYYIVGHSRKGCTKRIFPFTENDFRINEGASDTTTVRTLTGGQFRRDAQFNDVAACVNDKGTIRDLKDETTCIDANYHKGTDFHGARTMIRKK